MEADVDEAGKTHEKARLDALGAGHSGPAATAALVIAYGLRGRSGRQCRRRQPVEPGPCGPRQRDRRGYHRNSRAAHPHMGHRRAGEPPALLRRGKPWRCGQRAALALSDWIGQRTVACAERDRDCDGRVVATCSVGGDGMAAWLVRNGWALDRPEYSKGSDAGPQREAATARAGIWQGDFEKPVGSCGTGSELEWWLSGEQAASSQRASPQRGASPQAAVRSPPPSPPWPTPRTEWGTRPPSCSPANGVRCLRRSRSVTATSRLLSRRTASAALCRSRRAA